MKKVYTIQVWDFDEWITDSVFNKRSLAVRHYTELRKTLRVRCLEEDL